jgi:hypothetical protein
VQKDAADLVWLEAFIKCPHAKRVRVLGKQHFKASEVRRQQTGIAKDRLELMLSSRAPRDLTSHSPGDTSSLRL